jgi:hypothetical protein
MSQDAITPDTKDWTWVLDRPCPDCGFVASDVPAGRLADGVRRLTEPWAQVLADPRAAQRSRPDRWSPLEYGCHVRDVCRVFAGRVRLVLAEDAPEFANWDQDESAAHGRYAEQDPAAVATQVAEDAAGLAAAFDHVPDGQWDRTGNRSDGSRFTLLTLGQYGLHDLAHHLWDVGVERPPV